MCFRLQILQTRFQTNFSRDTNVFTYTPGFVIRPPCFRDRRIIIDTIVGDPFTPFLPLPPPYWTVHDRLPYFFFIPNYKYKNDRTPSTRRPRNTSGGSTAIWHSDNILYYIVTSSVGGTRTGFSRYKNRTTYNVHGHYGKTTEIVCHCNQYGDPPPASNRSGAAWSTGWSTLTVEIKLHSLQFSLFLYF